MDAERPARPDCSSPQGREEVCRLVADASGEKEMVWHLGDLVDGIQEGGSDEEWKALAGGGTKVLERLSEWLDLSSTLAQLHGLVGRCLLLLTSIDPTLWE